MTRGMVLPPAVTPATEAGADATDKDAGAESPGSPPPTRAIELPATGATGTTRSETGRTEPGTWREIIARFERELDPAPDADSTEAAGPATEAPTGGELPPAAGAEDMPGDAVKPDQEAVETGAAASGETADLDGDVSGGAGKDGDDSAVEEVAPGAPPSLDEAVPWEIAAMTTLDYTPPHSIHDREHDSWPVDTEDGDAVPAWSEDVPEDRAPDSAKDPLEEIGELLLNEEAPTDPWDADIRPRDAGESRSDFPLDAFIVPAGVHHAPTGYDADVARRVALRLDELARQLRGGGLQSLGRTDSTDELSRVLAAIVTGYVARDN